MVAELLTKDDDVEVTLCVTEEIFVSLDRFTFAEVPVAPAVPSSFVVVAEAKVIAKKA